MAPADRNINVFKKKNYSKYVFEWWKLLSDSKGDVPLAGRRQVAWQVAFTGYAPDKAQ